MKRTFLAIEIPYSNELADFLKEIKKELKEEKVRWVVPKNIHITLFFIGDTLELKLRDIIEKITEAIPGIKPFKIKLKNIGIFKSVYKPRVIWLGLENVKPVVKLKRMIDEVMSQLRFDVDNKEFKPHLTLGRIKYVKDIENLEFLIDAYSGKEIQEVLVNEISFYESVLTPQGPVYKILSKFKLE